MSRTAGLIEILSKLAALVPEEDAEQILAPVISKLSARLVSRPGTGRKREPSTGRKRAPGRMISVTDTNLTQAFGAIGLGIVELRRETGVSKETLRKVLDGKGSVQARVVEELQQWLSTWQAPKDLSLSEQVLLRFETTDAELEDVSKATGIPVGRLESIVCEDAPALPEEAAAVQRWLDLPVVPHPSEEGRYVVLG